MLCHLWTAPWEKRTDVGCYARPPVILELENGFLQMGSTVHCAVVVPPLAAAPTGASGLACRTATALIATLLFKNRKKEGLSEIKNSNR